MMHTLIYSALPVDRGGRGSKQWLRCLALAGRSCGSCRLGADSL